MPQREPGVYAVWETSMGTIVCRLFEKETPKTVRNFIELAEGKREFTDVASGEKVKRPFYDKLAFHRVIPDFMVQGGCPRGDGTGGPGYNFEDEFHPDLKHDRPGILSMANSGPNTGGSQFFITLAATGWLDDKHAVFGKVVEGLDIIRRIGGTPTGAGDVPLEPVVMQSVELLSSAEASDE